MACAHAGALVVGKAACLHKPLYKGEHAQKSLAKVFQDPGMRPKVFVKEPVNHPQFSLISKDIGGAQVRGTDGWVGVLCCGDGCVRVCAVRCQTPHAL
jgi:hypothetical protein